MTSSAEESPTQPDEAQGLAHSPNAAAGSRITRAWHHRPFAVFLSGSLLSWVGDWMDLAALNWAVLELTDSPLDLGIVNACRLAPIFVLSVPAGVLADRYDRRRLLIILQVGLMLLTFAVGLLFALRASFWIFTAVVTLRSATASMVLPIRNAVLPALVQPQTQAEAIALQTAAMNLSRIVGPALAGLIIAWLSTESVFWINGVSFVAVLATTWYIRPSQFARTGQRASVVADLQEAFAYILHNRLVRSLLMLAIVPMVFGFPYTTMMPVFARDLFGLGPEGFGLLLSVSGAGALCGASWLSFAGGQGDSGRRLVRSIMIFGAALIITVLTTGFYLPAAALFVVGWASQSYRTLSRITLLAEVPDQLRGRILSVALLDRGFIPLGTLLLGAIAEHWSARAAGVVMGASCMVLTLFVMAIDRRIWRV